MYAKRHLTIPGAMAATVCLLTAGAARAEEAPEAFPEIPQEKMTATAPDHQGDTVRG